MKRRFLYFALLAAAGGASFFALRKEPAPVVQNVAALARLSGADYDRIVTKPLTERKLYAELEAVHRAVIKENPALTEAKVALGELLRETGRAKAALEWHRAAREDHPENPFIVWNMLQDLEAMGQVREAQHGADILLKEKVLPEELRANLRAFFERVGDTERLAKLGK